MAAKAPPPQVQPCRYKVGKTLGAGSYSVVKECVHIDTGRCYAAKVINKRLMAGREHMVRRDGGDDEDDDAVYSSEVRDVHVAMQIDRSLIRPPFADSQ